MRALHKRLSKESSWTPAAVRGSLTQYWSSTGKRGARAIVSFTPTAWLTWQLRWNVSQIRWVYFQEPTERLALSKEFRRKLDEPSITLKVDKSFYFFWATWVSRIPFKAIYRCEGRLRICVTSLWWATIRHLTNVSLNPDRSKAKTYFSPRKAWSVLCFSHFLQKTATIAASQICISSHLLQDPIAFSSSSTVASWFCHN